VSGNEGDAALLGGAARLACLMCSEYPWTPSPIATQALANALVKWSLTVGKFMGNASLISQLNPKPKMLCCPLRRQHSILGFGFNCDHLL